MTSIWAEWFRQNGMTHAEERERMADQPQKPVSKELMAALQVIESLPPMRLTETHSLDIDLLDGMLAELCADRKKLRMTLYGIQAKIQRLLCIPFLGHTETILLREVEVMCREVLREKG